MSIVLSCEPRCHGVVLAHSIVFRCSKSDSRQPGRLLWAGVGVFILLILTSMCGALPDNPGARSANQPAGGPGQTETAGQQVLATIRAANATGTLCIGGVPLSTPYVAIWELFGTPTQTPTRTITPGSPAP